MKDINFSFNGLTFLGFLAAIVVALFIAPWISFWLAYFGGWIAKLVIGTKLVEGFSLFGFMMPLAKIPLLAGTLGWIGSFFKNASNLVTKYK